MTDAPVFDETEFMAHVDMLGRMGCIAFEVGHVHDNVPVHLAGWYAHVTYQGMRQIEADHPGPLEAARALARRLLDGGGCKCARRVTLVEGSQRIDLCLWQIRDGRWVSSCDAEAIEVKGAKRGDVDAIKSAWVQQAQVLARGGNRAERRARRRNRKE